jgi:hypothetical protein
VADRKGRYPKSLRVNPTEQGRPTRVRRMTSVTGTQIRYLARRLIPPIEAVVVQNLYVVQAGDRIDLVANKLLGDPLQYWRISDANLQFDPLQLCSEPGRRLRIPAPLGDARYGRLGEPSARGTTSSAPAPVSDEHDDDEGGTN